MTEKKRMYIGAASGAVTVGLALLLVLVSYKPEATKAERPPADQPLAEQRLTEKQPPARNNAQSAVRLPPPPRPAPAQMANAAADKPSEAPLGIAVLAPLKPRPRSKPPHQEQQPKPQPTANSAQPDASADPPANAPATELATEFANATIVSRETFRDGRALLIMLETGKGPVIEIAWPARAKDRTRLYHLLTACHGLQTAILSGTTRLFAANEAPGVTWRINRDAVSGYVRRPAGVLTDMERTVIRQIKKHHGLNSGTPVRLFPRDVDAALLGGLGQIVGPGYMRHRTIHARYRLAGNRVTVGEIRADSEDRPGGIVLPRTQNCD